MKTLPSQIPHGMFSEDYRSAIYKVGDGVTMHSYSDSEAGTVIEVSKSGKKIKVRLDKATLSPDFKPEFVQGGFAGHCTNQSEQSYTYEQDEDGRVAEYSLRTWRGVKVWTSLGASPNGSSAVSHGRSKFRDYNF